MALTALNQSLAFSLVLAPAHLLVSFINSFEVDNFSHKGVDRHEQDDTTRGEYVQSRAFVLTYTYVLTAGS